MNIAELLASIAPAALVQTHPVLGLSEVFTLLFVTMGPPLKTPMIYAARMHAFDVATQRALAWKTFLLALVAALIGGFLGMALRQNWHISMSALLIAGGIIFFLVSLRTVLEQYDAPAAAIPPNAGEPKPALQPPGAFALAVPMILTPYGLAGLIILLSASHDGRRTAGIVLMLVGVMVLHLLAMLFATPIVRHIGVLPFRLFGTVIGSLTVGLSIQMVIAGLGMLGTAAGA